VRRKGQNVSPRTGHARGDVTLMPTTRKIGFLWTFFSSSAAAKRDDSRMLIASNDKTCHMMGNPAKFY